MAMDEARRLVIELVHKWQALTPRDLRDYNEENTKHVFIQPLFEALGWDFQDLNQVTAEFKAGTGRVDYAFRVKGVSRFYLEAKPLRGDLATHKEWHRQAVTYAYTKGIPWVVLTNFRDLWVFTGVGDRRFIALSATEFEASMDRLWLLSRESVESGLLEEEGAKAGAIPPRIPIEQRLYSQLRRWREQLFTEIAKYHPELDLDRVDEVIQKLFNRLIFIRTCEDRKIENERLRAADGQYRVGNLKGSLLKEVRGIFKSYDRVYDSDLFSPHLLDDSFGKVSIDDPTISDMIQGLYDVPGGLASYDFSAIDADILGAVYEQYLGHVAQVAKQRARQSPQARMALGIPENTVFEVTSRPQRRKEKGIYYTPKWVVDYIVQQTLGKFIEEHEKTPESIHEVKILDMACGSGSFLIRAYDELLEWHARNFGRTDKGIDPSERNVILRNNMFGVDLDSQAIEIARLNLLLRALGAPGTLPSLADNVKVGNSLISGGEEELRPYFGDGWEEKRSFDWGQEFKNVMDKGGFDIIIGNPPYVRIQSLDRDDADYYRSNFEAAYGSFDLYVMFLEQGLKLLKPGGRLGFITSGKFLKSAYGKKIREFLRREATIETIVDLSALKVFADATTYPVMIILKKGTHGQELVYRLLGEDRDVNGHGIGIDAALVTQAGQEAITKGIWPPLIGRAAELGA